LIIEENHIERQRKALQAKQRAVSHREKVQTERNIQNNLNVSQTNNIHSSSSNNDKYNSRIKVDENFNLNNESKMEKKGLDSRRHTADKDINVSGHTPNRHTDDRNINNGGVTNFKLSQKTFKKIVLDKQQEQKKMNLQIEGRNTALKKNVFNNSDLLSIDTNILHKKGSQKILDNIPSVSGINRTNKGFFINQDM
jgi:hypothetical protein